MKSSNKTGKISLGNEVINISPFGIWLFASGKEYFLVYEKYPWFKNATVSDVLEMKYMRAGHLRWEKLDVDLHIDSLDFPDQYPLVAKSPPKVTTKKRLSRAAVN